MNNSKKLLGLVPKSYALIKTHRGLTAEYIIRWICRRSFLAFCIAVQPKFLATRIHTYLAHRLQRLYDDVVAGRDCKIELDIQPQLGKSTLTSVLFAAWVLGKESWPVIVASYGAALAERKSQECRDIVDSPIYRTIFPRVRLHPDSTSKEFWRTTTGGSYRAVGVGGGLTGMSGKILIADDLLAGMAEAQSDQVTEMTWSWWNTVFYTRKQSRSGFVLINTRWSLKDVSSRLEQKEEQDRSAGLPDGSFDTWERLKFPAIADEDEYLDGALFRRKGEVLCPERFTYEDMVKTRNALSVYEWAALYQQNPILNADSEFRSSWFRYFVEDGSGKEEDILSFKSQLDIYITVDLAVSMDKRADNTSIQVIGKLRDRPNWYHLEEQTAKMDTGAIIEYLFMLKDKYGDMVRALGIESVGYQRTLGWHITERSKKTGIYFNIIDLKNTAKKEDRIRGLIPLYKAGVIFHRQGVDNELETELLQFPRGRHDDRIDSLSMMLQVVKNTARVGAAHVFRPAVKRY